MQAEGLPAVVYTHPWEYDVDQPRLPLPRLRALRHYGRTATTRAKLARLLREFSFTTCAEVLAEVRGRAAAPSPAEVVAGTRDLLEVP
jgi:hypothetical protein